MSNSINNNNTSKTPPTPEWSKKAPGYQNYLNRVNNHPNSLPVTLEFLEHNNPLVTFCLQFNKGIGNRQTIPTNHTYCIRYKQLTQGIKGYVLKDGQQEQNGLCVFYTKSAGPGEDDRVELLDNILRGLEVKEESSFEKKTFSSIVELNKHAKKYNNKGIEYRSVELVKTILDTSEFEKTLYELRLPFEQQIGIYIDRLTYLDTCIESLEKEIDFYKKTENVNDEKITRKNIDKIKAIKNDTLSDLLTIQTKIGSKYVSAIEFLVFHSDKPLKEIIPLIKTLWAHVYTVNSVDAFNKMCKLLEITAKRYKSENKPLTISSCDADTFDLTFEEDTTINVLDEIFFKPLFKCLQNDKLLVDKIEVEAILSFPSDKFNIDLCDKLIKCLINIDDQHDKYDQLLTILWEKYRVLKLKS